VILATLRIALRALLRNKMRSLLTTLGVVIGVGAVIAMVAIGEGAKAMVEKAFASMGANLLVILPGASSRGGVMGGFGSMPTLTWEDLDAIRREASAVRLAAATLRNSTQLVGDDLNWQTSVYGTSPAYFDIRAWPIDKGRLLQDSDIDGALKVVVLGKTVADQLFGPGMPAIGRSVRMAGQPFEVVGVLQVKGQSPMGQDYDDTAFVPQTTFTRLLSRGMPKFIGGSITVAATSTEDTARAQRQMEAILRDRHRIGPGMDDDFQIRNLTEMASAQQQGTQTLTSLLAAIAAVSLLVGGIGIMNIMLVSVTERTREIGLRMAIGATPGAILAQFLVEALVLSMLGGLIGVAAGAGVAQWIGDMFGWPVLLRADVIGVAVAFSALVGVGFGLYPARKAAALDPIEALRFE
jgi:putative ABC transport system permease protein